MDSNSRDQATPATPTLDGIPVEIRREIYSHLLLLPAVVDEFVDLQAPPPPPHSAFTSAYPGKPEPPPPRFSLPARQRGYLRQSILRVCRKFLDEAKEFLYGKNKFRIPNVRTWQNTRIWENSPAVGLFMEQIGRENASLIRHVCMSFEWLQTYDPHGMSGNGPREVCRYWNWNGEYSRLLKARERALVRNSGAITGTSGEDEQQGGSQTIDAGPAAGARGASTGGSLPAIEQRLQHLDRNRPSEIQLTQNLPTGYFNSLGVLRSFCPGLRTLELVTRPRRGYYITCDQGGFDWDWIGETFHLLHHQGGLYKMISSTWPQSKPAEQFKIPDFKVVLVLRYDPNPVYQEFWDGTKKARDELVTHLGIRDRAATHSQVLGQIPCIKACVGAERGLIFDIQAIRSNP